jgi:HK97 family phage major capsid protein
MFGVEILRHSRDSVDLTRLNDSRHPLLLNHDQDRQIGVVEKAWLDSDKKLRGMVRFGRSQLAQEIKQDVDDGIRSLVSVGYMIQEVEEEARAADGKVVIRKLSGEEFELEMRNKFGENFYRAGPSVMLARESQNAPPTYVVTRWQPFEVTICPVPADAAVGVGRSAGAGGSPEAVKSVPTKSISTGDKAMDTPTKPLEGAEAERARVSAIASLGEQYGKYVDQRDVSEAIRNGRSVEQFKDAIITKMESKATDVSQREVGLTKKEVERYSLARAILASVTGDWSGAGLEREASAATARLFGRNAEGFYVPFDYWQKRDFNMGTSSEAGYLRETVLRTDLYTDALRNAMVLAGMGLRILPGLTGNVAIPRKATASALGMLTEIGSASESNPTTAQPTLSPKRVGAYIEVSKQALIQSAMALESMLRDDLLMGAAVLLESQVLNGVGSNGEMAGIRNTASIGTVTAGANGATLAWSHLVDLESACANSNAEPGQLAGYVVNTKTRGRAKQVTKSTYLPWLWQDGSTPLNGHRVGVTNNLPSNLTKGTSTTICSAAIFSSDYSMGVLGLFGAPDIVVDPYSKADTGQVKITLNQFADFCVRQPAAFAKLEDILTT